jgi:Fe-S-cluster containining protein
MSERAPDEMDVDLLRGFRYACRPGCGLCCYAQPRIEAAERSRLLKIAPDARFVGRGPHQFLAGRSNGGACQFLTANRCRVHDARPHPCREFPITVHVGHRLQATLVLSCPGILLSSLAGWRHGNEPFSSDLASELSSIRARLGETTRARQATVARRGRRLERVLRAEGRWQDDAEVRATLKDRIPRPTAKDFPVEDPPRSSDGLEQLPMFYDGRDAPLAFARGLGGWEMLSIAEGGGAESLTVIPPPERPPPLDATGDRLLEGYLRYGLHRDAFLAAVQLDAFEAGEGSVLEWTERELTVLGAVVLARAVVRSKLHGGGDGTLTAAEVADGIRATDMDWLDRPTWGDRL